MRIEFIGAAHEVTGSCHFLRIGEVNALVDCGMEQGADIYENQEIPVNAGDIDYVFVTHAHIDHSGLLPLLSRNGFKGQVFATHATTQLCDILLRDSAHIQQQEAEWKNRKAKRAAREESVPLYEIQDVENVMRRFVSCAYDTEIEVCENIKIIFHDAGHLLGSAWIEIFANENGEKRKLIFSGDLGHGKRALIRDPEVPVSADYLIVESTYGDRLHDVPPNYAEELTRVLKRTFKRGGNVVIPAFSVGRTQEMLYYMREIKENELLPEFPDFEVYVDSPLSVEATNIFNENVSECFNEEGLEMIKNGVNPIRFEGLRTSVTSDDSKAINFVKKPIVILSASGMCEAGRIRHHLKYNLWRPECTVVFVGYQCPGTLGFNLLNGAEEVKLFGEPVAVKAEILNLPGISGHADKEHLTNWVKAMKEMPSQIFVVHGQDTVTDHFAEHLNKETGVQTAAPYSGDCYDLIAGRFIERAAIVPASKKKASTSRKNTIFDRLVAAGERLMAVIMKNKEGTNKDLSKFTDQIIALCEKWDR